MKSQIEQQLSQYQDPHLEANFGDMRILKAVNTTADGRVSIQLKYPYPIENDRQTIIDSLSRHLQPLVDKLQIDWDIQSDIKAHAVASNIPLHPQIKNIIAIASGKGGVGKSTTAVNLGLALSKAGATVGILDADIYGPSLPLMLGVSESAQSVDQKHINPIFAHGLQTMSLGYLVSNEETPMVWRGPMATSALKQLFQQTLWESMDYLIVDLPPGTGDIQLTMAQNIPVTAAVIVTTPQDLALLDAMKAKRMFDKVKVPVMGVIENMAYYECEHCGHSADIFGHGGGDKMAEKYQLPVLGQIPLHRQIRYDADVGKPTVISDDHHTITQEYRVIASKLAAKIAGLAKDYTSKFGKIVVENTANSSK